MTPLQRVGLGLALVFVTARVPAHPVPAWQSYDIVPDPIGWALVVWGVLGLPRPVSTDGLRWSAAVAAAVSVPLVLPQLTHRLHGSGSWAASLPQLVFCVLFCHVVATGARVQTPVDRQTFNRFGLLRWVWVLLALLPALVLGGHLTSLGTFTQLVSVAAFVTTILLCFSVHRRGWLGGPGDDPEGRSGTRGSVRQTPR